MTANDYRNTYSWQESIALGPQLVRLAEQLPSAEQMGLAHQLHSAMVELPTAVGMDLTTGGQARLEAVHRLIAILELVDRVYPALDASAAQAAVDQLAARLSAPDRFNETVSAPVTATPVADETPAAPVTTETPDLSTSTMPTPMTEPAVEPLAEPPIAASAPAMTPPDGPVDLPSPAELMATPPPVASTLAQPVVVAAGADPASVPLTPAQEATPINVQPNSGQ